MVQRSVGLLVLLLLTLIVGAAGQEDGAGPPEALYFEDQSPITETYNLTSYPPTANQSGTSRQFISQGNEALLAWQIGALPGAWNITTKSLSTGTVFLTGLDEVLPVPPQDPARAAATAGRIEIRIHVLDPALEPLVEGTVLFQPQPLQPRDEVFEIQVPLRANSEVVVSPAHNNDFLSVYVYVTGRNATGTNISPVHMHFGATETPSRLELEGFPYEAYRAWEDQENAERNRNDEILRTGNRSATTTPSPNGTTDPTQPPQTEPVSSHSVFVVVLTLAALAVATRRFTAE